MKQLYLNAIAYFSSRLPWHGLKSPVNSVRRTPDGPADDRDLRDAVLLVFRFLVVLLVARIILEVALNVFRHIVVLILPRIIMSTLVFRMRITGHVEH